MNAYYAWEARRVNQKPQSCPSLPSLQRSLSLLALASIIPANFYIFNNQIQKNLLGLGTSSTNRTYFQFSPIFCKGYLSHVNLSSLQTSNDGNIEVTVPKWSWSTSKICQQCEGYLFGFIQFRQREGKV